MGKKVHHIDCPRSNFLHTVIRVGHTFEKRISRGVSNMVDGTVPSLFFVVERNGVIE